MRKELCIQLIKKFCIYESGQQALSKLARAISVEGET